MLMEDGSSRNPRVSVVADVENCSRVVIEALVDHCSCGCFCGCACDCARARGLYL